MTGFSNRIELESSSNRNCDRGFDSSSIRARFDSIMEKFEHVHSFLECSNRAHIESNRNCDRVLESNRARIKRISSSNQARIAIVTDALREILLGLGNGPECVRLLGQSPGSWLQN